LRFISVSALTAFLISASMLNDVILFDVVSLAKILSIISIIFLLYSGLFLNKVMTGDVLVISYSVLLISNAFLLSGGGTSDRTIAITVSLLIGAVFYFFISKSKVKVYEYSRAYIYICMFALFVSLFQSLSGTLYFTNRIFMSELIPSLYRASGFMSDPNYFGLTLLIGFCFISYSFKKFGWLLKIIFSAGIVLTGSRSVLLCFIMLLIAEKYGHKLNFVKFFCLLLSLIIMMFCMYYFRDYLPNSLAMVFNSESYSSNAERNSLSDRMSAIESAIIAFKNFPISGYGLGNLVYYPLNTHGQMSHNTFLEILSESGIVGFVMFSVLLAYNAKRSFDIKDPQLKLMVLLLLFIFVLMSLTLVTHYSRLFFYILSILSLTYKEDLNEKA
jgi:O-antigen ligase